MQRHIVLAAFAAVIIPAALTGCRFGNYVEQQPQILAISTGLYNTAPRRLQYCVKTDQETCAAADSVIPVPDEWDGTVTDPVYVGGLKSDPARGYVLNLQDLLSGASQPHGFEIRATAPDWFAYSEALAPKELDATCKSQYIFSGQGNTIASTQPDYQEYKVSGTLQLTLRRTQYYTGDCSAFLGYVSACYQDVTQCEGASDQARAENQDDLREFFNDYVSRGILTPSQIPSIRELGYVLSYE